jgi:hypothetical protein
VGKIRSVDLFESFFKADPPDISKRLARLLLPPATATRPQVVEQAEAAIALQPKNIGSQAHSIVVSNVEKIEGANFVLPFRNKMHITKHYAITASNKTLLFSPFVDQFHGDTIVLWQFVFVAGRRIYSLPGCATHSCHNKASLVGVSLQIR